MITDYLNNYQQTQTNRGLQKMNRQNGVDSKVMIEYNLSSYFTNFESYNFQCQQCLNKNLMKLRGGGCGKSKALTSLNSQLQKNSNLMISAQLPDNYLTNLNEYLKLIVDEAQLICDTTKKNEMIKRLQWFIYNREHLNYFCNDENSTSQIYELAKGNFESLLTVLVTYLRNSGFICYQVLQICNELLRIMYIFQFRESKRFLKEEEKQDYLSKLSEFETQLEIEQTNIWKTGFEFEIKIMKIMIMNSKTDSKEGQDDALINFFKEAGKSIISLSPSEDLLSTIIEGGKYLLKKGIEQKLYPIETYQTYYLFQLIKWSIIRQLKSQLSVYKQIQQLKDVFQQYILVSDNWILHFSWIEMIMDVIAYRPIINKSNISMNLPDQSLKKWNLLIENNLIHCVSYNKNEAIMNLFQDQEKQIYDIELTRELDLYSKKKFVLFTQFLLKGDLTQNLNQWDHYKEFTFKKQKDKKQEDYEIILASYEIEILQKLINNIKSQQDELLSNHSGIIESFITYFKEPSQMLIQIIQDDQQASQKQFLQTYKQLIILSNHFKELSKFEVAKLDLLKSYLNQFKNQVNQNNLLDLKAKIDHFLNSELIEFIDQLLTNLLFAIEFASCTNEMNIFLDSKNQECLQKIIKKFEIDKFQGIFITFENNFNQFILNLRSYKENFIKFIQKEQEIKSMIIQVQDYNILSIIDYNQNCKQSITKRLQEIFKNKLKFFDCELITLEEVQQNLIDCKFIIITLQFLKQFTNIQSQYLMIIKQQLENYNKKTDLTTEQVNLDNKQTIYDILTQQLQKIKLLFEGNVKESDQQIIDINLKSLLGQIESDFNFIKSESEELQNSKNNFTILTLLTNAQFIILQVLNQNENLSILQELLKDYQSSLNAINQKAELSIQNVQIEENVNDKSYSLFNKFLDYNQLLIKNIKENKKYYKYYEKLLIFQIELIPQKKKQIQKDQAIIEQDQNKQQQGYQPDQLNQIKKLKETREKYFNKKVKDSIEKLIKSFDPEIQQENNSEPVINLKFTDFLQFFYSLSNSEYKKGLKADKINNSILQDIKNAYKETKEKLVDLIDLKPDHKVREGIVYNLIRLQQSVQEQKIKGFCCKYLQYIWVFEKDQRVRNLLKNKELVEIQKQLFAQDLDNLSGSIKNELKERMQKLENLQQEIKLEGNLQKREELQIQLKKTYEELDESLDNISEMSEAMDISLIFLKDISKDVKSIKASIDNLQESINQVGDDIRKLRGKRYDELLEIRKQKILFQSKLTEVDSVYVELKTIEYDPISGEIIKSDGDITLTKLMSEQQNDFKGEVNEFIWDKDSQKDVMLVAGNAGSGKSKAARKIEEFVWKQKGIQSKWIPIYVSLPTLKNPKFNLFEQALESENYQFDKYQIKEFKEAIQAQKEFIILILDSYDEMKQDCIQSNLILTNKLIQEFNTPHLQMKVIITTRKEILNTVGYQTWFYGQSLQSLKEVQLQNFNEEQQNEYLNQYVELSIKRKIKEIYEFVKQIAGQCFDLEEFLTIWGLISLQVKNFIEKSEIRGMDGIFFNKAEELIIAKIKTHKTLEILKEEQTTALRKDLLALWSANKFKSSIKSVNIENLLTTPFMLEIVVQVLPNMAKKYSGSQQMKELFIKNYLKLKKQVRISKIARESYQMENSKLKKYEQDVEQQISQEKEEEYQSKIEKAKIIQIVDMLDNENFFSKYSIVSQLKHHGNAIIVDNITIKLGSNDINYVIMALQMKRFTVFEFYESFINFYHEQQIQKQRELGKVYNQESFAFDIYQYSYSLAIDMTLRELSQIGYKPLGKLDLKSNYKIDQVTDDWLKQYFDIEDEYKKLIRSCILLSAKGSTFSFTHKSIQEFFVAKYIFDFLISLNSFDTNKENLEKNTKILINSVFNYPKFNISTDNFRGSINFIREQLINVENINSQLIELVKLSRNKDYCRAASNSIYLLCQMNVYLGSQDFSKIELANTDISGLSLFDCDLSYSKFQNVEINSCNLNFADLSNVKWINTICKEKPFLQGHKNGVLEVQFSHDGQFIVSIEEENNKIKLWNAEKYQFIKDLEGHTAQVNSLSFSSDSLLLFSGSDDCTILRWDFKDLEKIKSEIVETMENKVLKVKISQDSKKLYLQDDQQNFQILDLTKNGQREELFYQFQKEQYFQNFALHPTESKVALAYEKDYYIDQNTIEIVDYVKNSSEYLKYELVSTYGKNILDKGLVFSDDGQYFAIYSENEVIVWNKKQNIYQIQIQFEFHQAIKLNSILFFQDNELIFCSENFVFKNRKYQPLGKEKCFETQISIQGSIAAVVYEKKINIVEINNQKIQGSKEFDLQPNKILFSNDSSKLSFFLNYENEVRQFMILEVSTLTTICFIPFWNNYWLNYMLSNNFDKLFVCYDDKQKYSDINYSDVQLNLIKRVIKIDTTKIHKEIKNKELCISHKKFSAQTKSGVIAYTMLNMNSIKIYDVDKNQEIQEPLQYEEKEAQDILFSPTENELVVRYQKELLFWNIESKPSQVQNRIILQDLDIQSINYSPDGSKIVLVFENLFKIYEVKSCKLLKTIEYNNRDTKVSISLDNDLIAYFQNQLDSTVIVILNQKKNYEQTILNGHKEAICELIFTRDQQSIISASKGEIILWDLSTYKIKDQKNTYVKDYQITFSYNTKLVALFKQNVVELWKYSQNELIFIGSQVFDFSIDQLSFIHDDQHILIQQSNSKLLLCNLDNFQFQQTFSQSFEYGIISSDNLIALAQDKNINIYQNDLEKCGFSLQVNFSSITYLKFFENRQNLLLIQEGNKIRIWDYIKREEISKFKLFEQQTVPQLIGELLISQSDKYVSLWNLGDLHNIKVCGFHNDINFFSIQYNQEFGLGIINQQLIIIKNIFNVEFVLPVNSNESIKQIIMSIKKQFYIIVSSELFILEMNTKQIHQFNQDVNAVAYCEERDYIAVSTQSQIQLIQFSKNCFNIISTFDLQREINQCQMTFTNDGQGLSLNSYYMIKLFSITKNQKIICRGVFDRIRSDSEGKIEAQIFCQPGSSNQQQLLAIIDHYEKYQFRIINTQTQKRIVQINFRQENSYHASLSFELSFDEEKIFFVQDKQSIFSLDITNFETKKIENVIQSSSYLKDPNLRVIGRDSFVFVNEEKQIMQFLEQTSDPKNPTEITTIEGITYINYLPQQQLLAISTKKNNIIFWDIKAKKNVGTLKGHQDTIKHMTVSPYEGVLASSSQDRLIKLWTINQNESSEIQQAHSYSISSIAYSQDGQLLASGAVKGGESDVPIFLWNVIDKKLMIQLKRHKNSVTSLEFSYCSRYLVSGDDSGIILFWNIEYPQFTKVVYIIDEFNCSIKSLSISIKEQTLFVVYNQNLILKWNFQRIEKQQKEKALILNSNSKQYSFISNDSFVYFDQDQNKLIIQNIETQEQQCFEQKSKIVQLQTSKDGCLILCLQQKQKLGEEIKSKLFCVQKNKDNIWSKKQIFIEQSDSFLLSPDNKILYLAKVSDVKNDQYCRNVVNFHSLIHDFQKLRDMERILLYEFQDIQLEESFMSFDLTLTAIVSRDNKIQILDNNQKYIKQFEGCKCPTDPQISGDQKYLACSELIKLKDQNKSYNIITVWDINNPSNMIQLEIKECSLIIYQFSAEDSNKIYALYTDRTIRDWNVNNKQFSIIVTLSQHFDNQDFPIFSKNLNFLINKNQTCILIWDFKKKEELYLDVKVEFYLMVCSQNEDMYAVALKDKQKKGIKILKDQYKSIILFFENEIDTFEISICFSHDDQQLVICHNFSIYLYEINKQLQYKILGCWNINKVIQRCYLNSMNMDLVIIIDQKQLYAIKLKPTILGKQVLKYKERESEKYDYYSTKKHICCFSPDSKYLASLCPNLQIQESQDIQIIHEFKQYQGEGISYQSKDILVIANQQQLQILNIIKNNKNDKIVIEIENNKQFSFQYQIISFVFSQNHLLIQFNVEQDQKRVTLSEIDNLKENVFKAIYNYEGKPIFSENGNYFALSNQNQIQIINIQNIQQERCFELKKETTISQIFYLFDENLIILCDNVQVQILNSISFEIIRQKEYEILPGQIEFSQISKYLVFKLASIVQIYIFQNNEKDILPLCTFKANDDSRFDNITLSPKGDLLLTGEHNSKDFTNSITLWKIEQPQQICTNNKINDQIKILKFCPDGVTFAAGLSDGSINLYSIEISKTNFFKKQQQLKQNQNFDQFQIICVKSFSKQSLLTAQQSILSESQIESEKKSIVELFYQKGGLK